MIRAVTHIGVGGLIALIGWQLPVMGLSFCLLFLFYETIQNQNKKDQSHIDVFWACVGFGVIASAAALIERIM